MHNIKVSGIPDRDVVCTLPIRKGSRVSAWAGTHDARYFSVMVSFRDLMERCYGVNVTGIEVEIGS